MLHAVIMAGGSGTRFWPESRAARPKQLLKLTGERSLLAETAARLAGLAPSERTLVVTAAALLAQVAVDLPHFKSSSLIGEPCKRDTAPCIGLAAALVSRTDPEATLVVAPSDHVIAPDHEFQRAILSAAALVDDAPDLIVTLGIRPTYPAEVYGYIERGPAMALPAAAATAGLRAYRVIRFREKPPRAQAEEFLRQGTFFWNSGIFVWKARTILAALAERQPEMYARFQTIVEHWDRPDAEAVFAREFAAIEPISIDFAVMEHARQIAVIEAPFAWDDIGGWQAWARAHGTDEHGNAVGGQHLGLHTTGSVIRTSDDHLVVTLGLKDVIVVHTPDVTLVANKNDEESLRQVVKLLAERGRTDVL